MIMRISYLEIMMAQGPNIWWNLRKSRICTIPNRKAQASIWFLHSQVSWSYCC